MKQTAPFARYLQRLRTAGLAVLPLLTAAGLSAQDIWIDGIGTLFDDDMDPMTPDVPDHNGSGNWDDILKWDTGAVPSGVGVTVNFTNAYTDSNIQPRIRPDQEPHLTDGNITVGILNFEDTAADKFGDNNFPYEGETDFIMLGNAGAILNFDSGAPATIDGPAEEINFLGTYRPGDVVRFGRDDNLAIDGTNGLHIRTSGNVVFDGENFIAGPIVIRAIDSGPLSDLGDGSNTVNPTVATGTFDSFAATSLSDSLADFLTDLPGPNAYQIALADGTVIPVVSVISATELEVAAADAGNLQEYSIIEIANGPDGTADGDGGGDGQVEVQHNFAFGATGPGNETVFMGDGGVDQFGDNNRKEGSLRFGIDDNAAAFFDPSVDPALDGSRDGNGGLTTGYTVEEEFYFRFFPAGDNGGAGSFARKTWEDTIIAIDDVPVTLNGDLHFERGVDWDGLAIGEDVLNDLGTIEETDVRVGEIQAGDNNQSSNARGAWDTNSESITINGNIIINDQSGGETQGRFENNIELNPLNVDSVITVNGAIGSNAAAARDADPGDLLEFLRYQGVFKSGNGTLFLNGDNEFDGNLIMQSGTVILGNVGAVDDAQNVNFGNGGTIPSDVLELYVGAEGDFLVRANGGGNFNLDDINNNGDSTVGNELPYTVGMNVPGVASLDFGNVAYSGDGWNGNQSAGVEKQLDALEVTVQLDVVAGAQLSYLGRIQGQELAGDANTAGGLDLIADLGSVNVNKIGEGTAILNGGGSAHQYSGPTNVLEGVLLTDGTNQKTTSINVSSGATFGGEGTVGDATDNDGVLDRATDGIDNDEDGFADALDPEMDETGLYYDSDGDPLTGNGNYLNGIGSFNNANEAGRVRPKVSVPVTLSDGADLEVGLRDATQTSVTGALNIEGSVTFQGNNELRFNIGGPSAEDNAVRDRLNVNNLNAGASPNGEVAFTGTETFVIAETPGVPLEDGAIFTIITTDNGHNFDAVFGGPIAATGPAGFAFEVRTAGNPLNIVVEVTATGIVDTDGDLIPDDYETANGLNPNDPSDADSDLDGDGFEALFEYAMGTLAGDRASFPIWQIEHVSDTEVNITYGPITSGVTYNLNASADGETFSQIDSFTAGADGASNLVIDTSGGLDVELYQLEVPLPLP